MANTLTVLNSDTVKTYVQYHAGDGSSTAPLDGLDVYITGSPTISVAQTGSPWGANITQFAGVGVALNTGAVSTGTLRVTQATDDTVKVNQVGGPWTENITQLGGIAISLNTGVRDTGTQRVTVATNDTINVNITGANSSLGQSTMAGSVPVAIASDQSAIPVTLNAATSGGWSAFRNLDLGNTGVTIKTSAGQVGGWYMSNANSSSAAFVKLYNKASAPTGSDTPAYTLRIPAGEAANVGLSSGLAFATGIAARATAGVADADTISLSTNDVIVNLFFK